MKIVFVQGQLEPAAGPTRGFRRVEFLSAHGLGQAQERKVQAFRRWAVFGQLDVRFVRLAECQKRLLTKRDAEALIQNVTVLGGDPLVIEQSGKAAPP